MDTSHPFSEHLKPSLKSCYLWRDIMESWWLEWRVRWRDRSKKEDAEVGAVKAGGEVPINTAGGEAANDREARNTCLIFVIFK